MRFALMNDAPITGDRRRKNGKCPLEEIERCGLQRILASGFKDHPLFGIPPAQCGTAAELPEILDSRLLGMKLMAQILRLAILSCAPGGR